MKKMFFAVLVLLSISFLMSGCGVQPSEAMKCGVLSTPGTYNIDDLTATDPVVPPCVQITGDGITLDGHNRAFTGQIEITGNNNVVTNFGSLEPYDESHPAVSIVSGTGNEVYGNTIYTNHRYHGGGFLTCTTTGGVGVLLDGATGNKIHDNEFAGANLFDKDNTCVEGPSILAVNGANSNQVYKNDFHALAGGVANDGTSSLNAADFCLSGEGNWWSDSITFSSSIIMPWGITNFWKVEQAGCGENAPFIADVDLDGVAGRADDCPFQPNGNQQDLDGDGLGTPCDSNEFDINVQNWSSLGFITQTKDFTWFVPKDYIGPTYFLSSTVDVNDISSVWSIEDQHQYIGINPVNFGSGGLGNVEVKAGHAGVLYKNYVSGPNNCGGGMVTGPVSLAGVGYAYGFNKSCVDQFKAEGTDKYVEYIIDADPADWDLYEHWDADTPLISPKIDRTGQSFTIDPYDAQGTFINTSVMSAVFVPKTGNNRNERAVRFSLPMIGTSGTDLNLSSEQAANFTYYCTKIGNESSNNDPGIESLCHNATEVPRGTDTKYKASKMEFTYNGDGTYTVKAYIPAEFIQEMPEGTHELTIANAVSLAQRDIVNRLVLDSVGNWPEINRAFKFNSDLHSGSYIPCVGVGKCIFQGSETNPITVHFHVDDVGGLDITDPEVVRNGLGLAIQGKTEIWYTNFVSDNPYIGFAVAPGSNVQIHNSNFDNSILGWVVSNSYFSMEDSSITSASLQDIDQTTVELRDIRSMLLYQNGNESWWGYENENGADVNFTISTDILQGGLQAQTNVNLPPVQSGLNLQNVVVDAGELNGVLIVSDHTKEPIVLNNVTIPEARQGITIAGTSQDPAKDLDVDIVNLHAHTQQCGIVAGASDVSVTGGECNGYTATENDGSFTGWAVLMSGRGYADEQLNVYHTMDELDNYWVRSFTMTDHTITNHGTHPSAANYDWADKAVVVRDEAAGSPFKSAGTVHFENVVATLDGAAQPIAAYGEPEITTAGTTPEIVYPGECIGNSAIHAKVTSNDVEGNGVPGQQPLAGAKVMAFDKNDVCVATYFPDAQAVYDNCYGAQEQPEGSCVTGANGECTIDCLSPGDYFVIVKEDAYPGKYPSHVVGGLADYQTKFSRLAFLKGPTGKVRPGKSNKQSGSELWIYQPDYVVWSGTEEYYPFVFESDSDWTIDVCIDAPTGYQPVGGVDCVQTLVANEARSILFKLVEVGSVPGPAGVDFNMIDPHGKKRKLHSEIGMRLSKKLAKAKGKAIDKNGRLLGKGKGKGHGITGAAVTEGAGSVLAIVLIIAVLTLIGVGYLLNKNKKINRNNGVKKTRHKRK